MRVVPGEGSRPCRLLLCGERPGVDEIRFGRPFVGKAGAELWGRMAYLGLPPREEWYVTNLVKTFAKHPPTPAEVSEWEGRLRLELLAVRPEIIVTVGYHAARWVLPQFGDVNGDFFHGLVFESAYGRVRPRACLVVPVVHSAAALHQPDRYQQQLTVDLRTVARVLGGERETHTAAPFRPVRVGLASFSGAHILGCDTEGTRQVPEAVTLSAHGREAYLGEVHHEPLSRFAIQALYQAEKVHLHSAVHDYQVLEALGVDMTEVDFEDPMLMAYLLGLPQSLKVLAYRELGIEMQEYRDLVDPIDEANIRKALQQYLENPGTNAPKRACGSIRKILTKPAEDSLRTRWRKSVFAPLVPLPPSPTWKDVPEQVRVPYALTDAVAHRKVGQLLHARIKDAGLTKAYQVDKAVIPFLARNERVGLACDKAQLESLAVQFRQEFYDISTRISALAGHDVNPLSGEQVSNCLFTELGIRPTRPTTSGKHYTTEDKHLKARRLEHEIIPLIIEARQIDKMRGTYAERLPQMLTEDATGWRYYPDWRYTRTATGRLAEPIIVLIPKHSRRGLQIRSCFHATEGRVLVLVDLSQIEMRVMAHLSRDVVLLSRYQRGEDIHAGTAHDLLGAPKKREDQDDSLHRLPAKTMNFGIINGMTEYGMLDQLHEAGQMHWTLETVREFRLEWFKLHQGVSQYWHNQIGLGRKQGYITDLFGRRRYVAGLQSADARIVAEAERQCLAAIQATADGISKIWNRRIWHQIILKSTSYCEPWVRVHDETALEVDERKAQTTMARMLELVPDLLCLPTTAEGQHEQRWGEGKLKKLLEAT